MSNNKKPDFSNVQAGVRSTEQLSDKPTSNKPDFSNVQVVPASDGALTLSLRPYGIAQIVAGIQVL